MRITAIRVVELEVPIDPPFHAAWDPVPRTVHRQQLAFVETDEGLVGLGGGDLTGFDPYARWFVGTDPTDLGTQARRLASCCHSGGRFWGLEAAFWDLAGQVEGRSVAELVGGASDRVRAYASAGTRREPEAWADLVRARRGEGFDALKLRLDIGRPDHAISGVRAAREAGGDDFALVVDLNQAWRMPGDVTPAATVDDVLEVVGPFAEMGVTWLEEPLPLDDLRGLERLRADAGAMRLAGGEFLLDGAWAWHLLRSGALDVHQEDALLTMGLTELVDFGRAALESGAWFTPHTWGDGLALLVNLHLTCGLGGGPWLEYPHDPPGWTTAVRDAAFVEPIEPDSHGWLRVPELPGLGAVLDHDRIEHLTVAHRILT